MNITKLKIASQKFERLKQIVESIKKLEGFAFELEKASHLKVRICIGEKVITEKVETHYSPFHAILMGSIKEDEIETDNFHDFQITQATKLMIMDLILKDLLNAKKNIREECRINGIKI